MRRGREGFRPTYTFKESTHYIKTPTSAAANRAVDSFRTVIRERHKTESSRNPKTLHASYLQQQKQLLADSLEVTDFPDGSTLFRCGDVGDRFYLLKEGTVLLSKPSDKETPSRLTEGAYFGERSIIKDETRRGLAES